MPAGCARTITLRDQGLVVDCFEQLLEHPLVVAAVVDVPSWRPVGKLVGADQVATPQLDSVDPEIASREVD